jgi:hypothetical protein
VNPRKQLKPSVSFRLILVTILTVLFVGCGGRDDAPSSKALAVPEVKVPGGDGPQAEFAKFWVAILEGDVDDAARRALKGGESEANISALIRLHTNILKTEKAVEEALGEAAVAEFHENNLRSFYFNRIAAGIEFAKEEIALDGNSASVKIEHPGGMFNFTMKKEEGAWRVATWKPNRVTDLVEEAMERLRPRVGQKFYKSGREAYTGMIADLFKDGLPGNYELQFSQEGVWYQGERGVQIRTDTGGELKARFFEMKEEYRNGARIPTEDCLLPVFSEGEDFYFDETFMGWGRFAFNAGNYETIVGQNYNAFGTARAIRLKYLGSLE